VSDNPEEIDPEVLRDGGPTRSGGLRTTTGSSAGPGGPVRHPDHRNRSTDEKIAPTTTGDATTGGESDATGGSTSDNASGAPETM
jgi:hypothetical protein